MGDLHTYTLAGLQGMLADGRCSSVDIVNDVLASIDRTDGRVQAYVDIDRETALAEAAASDKMRAEGDSRMLLGIPLGVKDILNVEGQPCSCGSKLLKPYRSVYDATSVAKLKAEGAIMLGRLNMDEFGMGSTTENSSDQVTRNPWDVGKVPGGSSGGSAAAVAADSAIAALGSDTGGSIRQPASFCGCVGFKPSYGRVSRFGLTAYASSLDQVGTLTKDVRDAAILLEILAGHDHRDSTALETPVEDYSAVLEQDLNGVRIGLAKDFFVEGIHADVSEAVNKAVEHYQSLGAEIVDVSIPHLKYAIATYYVIATAEASTNLARYDGIRYGDRKDGDNPIAISCATRAAGFGTEVKRRIILGTYVLSSGYYDAYYLRAQKVRSLLRRDFEQAFASCDAMLTPVAPTPAYPIGSVLSDPLEMYLGDICTVPANLAGLCGLSQPCGFSAEGLPIGMQLLGPAGGEASLLRIGYQYEQSTEWHLRKPELEVSA